LDIILKPRQISIPSIHSLALTVFGYIAVFVFHGVVFLLGYLDVNLLPVDWRVGAKVKNTK